MIQDCIATRRLLSLLGTVTLLGSFSASALRAQETSQLSPKLKVYAALKAAKKEDVEATKAQIASGAQADAAATLPLWFYAIESPRDDGFYTGAMVGKDPFKGGGATSVPTFVVPVVVRTNSVVTAINSKTGNFTVKPGTTYFNPSAPDACLAAPNNVALTLFEQSPILQTANFVFGGTPVGVTQYVDAFQRSSFWKTLGDDRDGYHVLLNPVRILPTVVVDVPAKHGAAVPGSFFGGTCSTLGVVDINWLDAYLDAVVLPALKSAGVSPKTLPIFLYKNVVQSIGTPSFGACCVLGYHGTHGIPIQTYAVADFDTTQLFPSALQDTGIMSHEIAEWMNDPFGDNVTPAWGGTGQVTGCQNNLEVGDPLTGSNAPPIVMPNGFTYHLQELAFFSWFFGNPSKGIHAWDSNNGTFLKDAGPVCQTPAATSAGSDWKFIPLN